MKKFIYTCLLFLGISLSLTAQVSVQGIVLDEDAIPVIGATVMVGNDNMGTVSEFDGSFVLSGMKAGAQTMTISYIGYSDVVQELNLIDGMNDLGEITMEVSSIGLTAVNVIASSAVDRKTPVAVSTINAEVIEAKLGNQEFPEILKSTPSVYTTKSGGGFGDSRINIRGFSQENVALLINGVSVSGMEDNKVYWSNWSGLGDVTRQIQVQRGLGASKMAITSVGGTINVITKTTDMKKGGSISQSIGNNGYLKTGLTLSTGQTEKGWAFTFSGSKTSGNGYVDNTYIDAWSYFVAIAKEIGKNQQLSFTAIGAPQRHGQRDFNHKIGDQFGQFGEQYNDDWGTKDGQAFGWRENFYHKPQLALNHYWDVNDKTFLATSVYASIASGGGTGDIGSKREFQLGKDSYGAAQFDEIVKWNSGQENAFGFDGVPEYNTVMEGSTDTTAISVASKNGGGTIKRASMNDHNWFGVLSTVTSDLSETLTLTGGVDLRFYHGDHYRKTVDLLGADYWFDTDNINNQNDWVDFNGDGIRDDGELGNLVSPTLDASNLWGKKGEDERIDYSSEEQINWYGGFASLEYSKNELSAFFSSSVSLTTMQRFENFGELKTNTDSEVLSFIGYNVRAGANYNIDANHNVFANIGYLEKAPYFDAVFPRFNNTDINREAVNEKVLAFELGYGFRSRIFSANVNLYRTQWNDKTEARSFEDTASGERFFANLLGVAATHQGVELDFKVKAHDKVNITGMASMGDWQWKNNINAAITDQDQNPVGEVNIYLEGLKVGDVAQTTLALGLDVELLPGLKFDISGNYFANLYTAYDIEDRDEEGANDIQPMKLDNYGLIDSGLAYSFKIGKLDASTRLNINNLFNKSYIAEAQDNSRGVELERGSDEWNTALQNTRGWYGFGRTWNLSFKLRF
jgi:iron complex outermembrane receptor protein